MIDETPELREMNRHYERLTGLGIPLTLHHMAIWRTFLALGYTKSDLETVVRHLRRKFPENAKFVSVCNINRLIRDTDQFSEDLAEAKALARAPVYNRGKAQALRATGRAVEAETTPARSAAQILAGEAALKELLQLRDSL